jgi:hypothetical protein
MSIEINLFERNIMSAKYSPTVHFAYKQDANWFEKYKDLNDPRYDLDGYDCYGYDKNGVDRAGYSYYDYQESDMDEDGSLRIDVITMFVSYMPNRGGV